MRLVRFENRQEVFVCRSCEAETLLLDCHYCERRSVRQLNDSDQGLKRWACYRCQVEQVKCPDCQQGWVIPSQVLDPQASGFSCGNCQQSWLAAEQIGI